MPPLIDTHCHLYDSRLLEQLPAVLDRAQQHGVQKLIAVATDANTSQQCVQLAETYPQVFASIGVHPTYCHQENPGDWESILPWLTHAKVVALGETGLDNYWKECPLEVQERSFDRHWRLSQSTGLPVIIHMREATQAVVDSVRRAADQGPIYGVLHSFAESWDVAETLLNLGLYLSFAGMVTYKKSEALREVAKQVPLDRILVETDSPYLSPEPHRSRRPNEPGWVLHTAQCIADARDISLSDLAAATTRNAHRLFGKLGGGDQ